MTGSPPELGLGLVLPGTNSDCEAPGVGVPDVPGVGVLDGRRDADGDGELEEPVPLQVWLRLNLAFVAAFVTCAVPPVSVHPTFVKT